MTLTVDLKLDCIPVLSVETDISDYMAGAFIDVNSAVLEEGIRDLRRQIEATSSADDSRFEMGRRLQFAFACSMWSAVSGKVSTSDEN
jgi:hypothetical protein